MEDYVYQIQRYLPVEFSEKETNEFIDYLSDAYLENISNSKYQFAFTAFHMLYMSFIYKSKWFLKQRGSKDIDDALQEYIKRNKGAVFNSLFDLSQVSEKATLDKLLKTLKCHANDIDICKNHVSVRNNCSHASGKVYYKRAQQVENYITEELDNCKTVNGKLKKAILA